MRGPLLAAASAALLLAAAPPLALAPVALLALAPLLVAIRRAPNAVNAAALGGATGALFHLGLLLWLPATIARLQRVTPAIACGWFALFVAVHALQLALAAAGARIGHSPATRVVATVAGWVLLEWGYPKVFPWSLGAALGPHPLLRQAADLAGAHGLAALVVAINALAAEAIASWDARRTHAGLVLGLAALLMLAANAYGLVEGVASAAPGPGERGRAEARPSNAARFAVLQAGPSAAVSDPRAAAARAWADYARLSDSVTGPADVVVWPEGVLPIYLRDAASWRADAEALARRLRSTLVVGALARARDGAESSAAFFFTPTLSTVAQKVSLVPFGEYLPPALPAGAWQLVAARRAGAPPPVVDAGVRIASSMCFEAILPGHFNEAVRDGAEVLVNLSDDSWFASPWAAAQHLEMTRLRAVETRRWLVRASHSGISAIVDPRGDVVAALRFGARGALEHAVEPGRLLTPYARYGDAPLLALSAAALLLIGGGRMRCARHGSSAQAYPDSTASLSELR